MRAVWPPLSASSTTPGPTPVRLSHHLQPRVLVSDLSRLQPRVLVSGPVAPTRLRAGASRLAEGSSAAAPPLLQAGEETAESSPIGEPFISLFFTVINPSEHAASVAPGGEGRGEGSGGPGREGRGSGLCRFQGTLLP